MPAILRNVYIKIISRPRKGRLDVHNHMPRPLQIRAPHHTRPKTFPIHLIYGKLHTLPRIRKPKKQSLRLHKRQKPAFPMQRPTETPGRQRRASYRRSISAQSLILRPRMVPNLPMLILDRAMKCPSTQALFQVKQIRSNGYSPTLCQ